MKISCLCLAFIMLATPVLAATKVGAASVGGPAKKHGSISGTGVKHKAGTRIH